MKIDLSRIEQEPLGFSEVLELDPERLDCDQVAAPITVRLKGEVRTCGEDYSISGRWDGKGFLACTRCLEPVAWNLEEPFAVDFRLVGRTPLEGEIGLGDEDLEVVFLENPEIDLVEFAAEQIHLALPMRVVCDEECAGLCPRCGANLNHDGACKCEPEVDPRWHALADLAGVKKES